MIYNIFTINQGRKQTMKTIFNNVDKNLALWAIFDNIIRVIEVDVYGKETKIKPVPRINLGDDILTIFYSYSWDNNVKRINFYSTDSVKDDNVYVSYENKWYKILPDRFAWIEQVFKDSKEIIK